MLTVPHETESPTREIPALEEETVKTPSMRRSILILAAGALVVATGCASTSEDPKVAAAKEANEARNLLEKSRIAADEMTTDKAMGDDLRHLLAKAKGVFIAPEVLRAAFIFGGSGGSGVFMARTPDGRGWHGPAFYTLGGVSWGLQIGGDSSEVILLAMTDRGVNAFLSPNVKLGAGVSVAAGPVGGGASAATANLSADILSFSRSKGAYAGLSLDGAVVAPRGALNDSYYGKDVSPSDVLVRGAGRKPDSAALITTLNKASATK
jgi:lipid-binding SYLF domain-containing protein